MLPLVYSPSTIPKCPLFLPLSVLATIMPCDGASLTRLVAFMVLMCVKLAVLICFWFGVQFTCNIEREEKGFR